MKRLAVFAEGGTEQAFVEKLLIEVAGTKNIQIRKEKHRRGANGTDRSRKLVAVTGAGGGHEYYALIVDCGNEERVKSDLLENYESLCKNGYNAIIGIRDVRGKYTAADIPALVTYQRYGLKTSPVNPLMVLAIMETEAWFLAEHTHFGRINDRLTLEVVTSTLNFDPAVGNVETRERPADDINLVYQTVGDQYIKTPESIQRTIDALDLDQMYLIVTDRVPAFKLLVNAVNEFLS
jgi:hypothetical protein